MNRGIRYNKPIVYYKMSEYIEDQMPYEFVRGKKDIPGMTQGGNERVIVQEENGFKRFITYSNAKNRNILNVSINIPKNKFLWKDMKTEKTFNEKALELNIITQEDFDYFYK